MKRCKDVIWRKARGGIVWILYCNWGAREITTCCKNGSLAIVRKWAKLGFFTEAWYTDGAWFVYLWSWGYVRRKGGGSWARDVLTIAAISWAFRVESKTLPTSAIDCKSRNEEPPGWLISNDWFSRRYQRLCSPVPLFFALLFVFALYCNFVPPQFVAERFPCFCKINV